MTATHQVDAVWPGTGPRRTGSADYPDAHLLRRGLRNARLLGRTGCVIRRLVARQVGRDVIRLVQGDIRELLFRLPLLQLVLLVEDEEHLALGLQFNLENAGYEVALARTGEEGVAAVAERPVDLIVLDAMLPGELDGYDVARQVRREGHLMPIIML